MRSSTASPARTSGRGSSASLRSTGRYQTGVRSARDLDPGDITLLQAAAMTQRQTGVAISLHSPRSGFNDVSAVPAILDVLDILADAGADLGRVVVGHADRTTFETAESLAAVAARGPYIQLDGWGWEGYISLDSWAPSDEYRFRLTRGLIALGTGAPAAPVAGRLREAPVARVRRPRLRPRAHVRGATASPQRGLRGNDRAALRREPGPDADHCSAARRRGRLNQEAR